MTWPTSADFPLVPPSDGFVRAWLAAFGLVVGSFLNVVIHRLPRGRSVVRPRSACPACGRLIPWYENVPVVSWIALRGRCSGCRARISPRYALVELLTAALLVGAYERFGPTLGLPIAGLLCCLLLCLLFIDLDHMLLPDALTLPGTVLGLALSFVSPFTTPGDALLGMLLAIVLVEGLNLAYKLESGRDGLGAGDTKMLMMVGAFLGWQLMIFSLLAASILGTVVGLPILAWRRRRKTAPPADVSRAALRVGRLVIHLLLAPVRVPVALLSQALRRRAASDGEAGGAMTEPAPSAEEERGGERSASRASLVLHDLVPGDAGSALLAATGIVLASTFVVPGLDPERAVGGLLVGIVGMIAHERVRLARGKGGPSLTATWPLVGSVAGLPPHAGSGAAAALVVAVAFGLGGSLDAWLRRHDVSSQADVMPAMPEGASEEEPREASPLLQAELPLGVFIGVAGIVALFAGPRLLEHAMDVAARFARGSWS